MLRTTMLSFAGALSGMVFVVFILVVTNQVIYWMTAPQVFKIEYSVVYLTVVLGAGFGGLCGALIGAAGVVAGVVRDRGSSGGR